jgi:hypothetical protein
MGRGMMAGGGVKSTKNERSDVRYGKESRGGVGEYKVGGPGDAREPPAEFNSSTPQPLQ